MTANKQGLDPDKDYTAVDNPFWDCTDAAHPAWWRGSDHGSLATTVLIKKWLYGHLDDVENSHSNAELDVIRMEILYLRRKAGS